MRTVDLSGLSKCSWAADVARSLSLVFIFKLSTDRTSEIIAAHASSPRPPCSTNVHTFANRASASAGASTTLNVTAPRFRQCLMIGPCSSTRRVDSDRAPITAARCAPRRPGRGQQRRARRREAQSSSAAYVFNIFAWLAEAARDTYPSRDGWPSWPCMFLTDILNPL